MLRGNYCAAWFSLNRRRVVTFLQEFWIGGNYSSWRMGHPTSKGGRSANNFRESQICQFADLWFVDPIFLKTQTSAHPQMHHFSPYKHRLKSIYTLIRKKIKFYSYMTLQLLHSEFPPYKWGKVVFLFDQCTYMNLYLISEIGRTSLRPNFRWFCHERVKTVQNLFKRGFPSFCPILKN